MFQTAVLTINYKTVTGKNSLKKKLMTHTAETTVPQIIQNKRTCASSMEFYKL
jgi:hypothetical protein